MSNHFPVDNRPAARDCHCFACLKPIKAGTLAYFTNGRYGCLNEGCLAVLRTCGHREVIFLASESADEYLAVLDEFGPEDCIRRLIGDIGDGQTPDKAAREPFGAPADDHFVSVNHPGYVLSWNLKLNYMGLALKL